MRDVIWNIIVLWVIWKIYDAFKLVTKTNHTNASNSNKNQTYQKKEGEVKIENLNKNQKSHFKPSDGEYVDYEDIT